MMTGGEEGENAVVVIIQEKEKGMLWLLRIIIIWVSAEREKMEVTVKEWDYDLIKSINWISSISIRTT